MPSTPRRFPARERTQALPVRALRGGRGTLSGSRTCFHALALAAIAVVTTTSCRGGCQREAGRAATVEGRLAMFPVSTRVVVSLDAGKLRAGPAAAKLTALAKPTDADDR